MLTALSDDVGDVTYVGVRLSSVWRTSHGTFKSPTIMNCMRAADLTTLRDCEDKNREGKESIRMGASF